MMRSSFVPTVALALAAGLSIFLAGSGCGRPPPGMVTRYEAGSPELAMSSFDPLTNVWQSAPWEGAAWIPYPGRATIQVSHTLGRVPRQVLVYLAFQEIPFDAGPGPGEGDTPPALAAGDLARVVDVTATTVTVWNDTNGAFFARIVLY